MTTAVLSKSSAKKMYWSGAYFFGELRRSWAHALLYALAFFFTMTVPMMSRLSDTLRYDFYSIAEVPLGNVLGTIHTYDPANNRFAEIDYYVYVIVAMLIAVWAGIFAVVYLNRRVSAYFYHSLPIAREGILLVKSAVALVDFAAALVLNLGLTAVFYLQLPGVDNPAPLFVLAGYCLLTFAVIYCFVILMGALCGTSIFHFIMIALSVGLLPMILSAVILLEEMVVSHLEIESLLEMRLTSPYLYLYYAFLEYDGLSALQMVVLGLFGALSLFGALMLVRYRPTEAAESPVAFRPVGAVIKYAVIGTATVLLAFFFEEIFGGLFGFIFGFLCGLVLSFMLMNVLLTRSVRQMFRGVRGLIIFAIALVVAVIGIWWAYSYRDDHAIPAERVVSVSIREYSNQDNIYGEITDPAAIELVSAYLEAYFACCDGQEVSYDLQDLMAVNLTTVSVEAEYPRAEVTEVGKTMQSLRATRNVWLTQTTRSGLSYTWRVSLNQFDALRALETELCRTITECEEFKENYVRIFAEGASEITHYIRGYKTGSSLDANSAEYQAMLAELREQIGYEFFQQQQIDSVDIRINRRYYTFPIYESQTALIRLLGFADSEEMKQAVLEEQQTWFEYVEDFSFTVYKRNADGTVESVEYTPADPEPMWRASAVFASSSHPSIFTQVSDEYIANTVDWVTVIFIDGKVPEFVTGLFE